jgi:hypothetical protein
MQRERGDGFLHQDDESAGVYVRRRDEFTTEDIHVRSHDHRWAYDLDIDVQRADGKSVFEKRYYVTPGETVGEVDILPPGEYDITVTVDNDHTAERRCRIDASAAHTAVVEVGNGVLSLTEGLNE